MDRNSASSCWASQISICLWPALQTYFQNWGIGQISSSLFCMVCDPFHPSKKWSVVNCFPEAVCRHSGIDTDPKFLFFFFSAAFGILRWNAKQCRLSNLTCGVQFAIAAKHCGNCMYLDPTGCHVRFGVPVWKGP